MKAPSNSSKGEGCDRLVKGIEGLMKGIEGLMKRD